MQTGKFAHRAITGYPLTLPDDDKCILSTYKIKANGTPLLGNDDYNKALAQVSSMEGN
jgi:hypothetical protein